MKTNLLTRQQVAEILNVSRTTVYRLGQDGKLTPIKLRDSRNSTCFYNSEEVENLKNFGNYGN